jgi:hypothetical protein
MQYYDGLDASSTHSLTADLSNATAQDVIAIRRAFALQRYQEARAAFGSEYVDYLRYCGVIPSDSRLQRPEYLGGGKQTVTFSEVLRTEGASGSGLGDLGGHGIAALRSNRYRRFFEEHGHIITCMSIRPKSVYMNPGPKMFTKTTKEDYFQKELQMIGMQEIKNREVYAGHTTPDGTFGFAPRYHDYFNKQSYVSGQVSITNGSAREFSMARDFSAADPALNSSFIECSPRNDMWSSTAEEDFQCMIQHQTVARRYVGKQDVGRIV